MSRSLATKMELENFTNNEQGWSSHWFPQGNKSPEIQSAKEVLQDSKVFLKSRLPRLGKNSFITLTALLSHKKQKVSPSEKLPGTEILVALENVSLEQLSSYVDYALSDMKEASEGLTMKRSRGFHKATAKAQSFIVAFDRLLKAFSGVVDIVKQADAQYGNVASSTLSLFYATAITKAEAEQSIHETVIEISNRLPEYKVYERIFPDPDFGRMLAEEYSQIIRFARTVTIYFQGNGIGRFFSHLLHIGKFDGISADMTKGSNRIRERSDVLLAEKVDRLEKDNENLHKRKDVLLVSSFRSMLHLQAEGLDYIPNILRDYDLSVRPQFDNDRRREVMNLKKFQQDSNFQSWTVSRSILLLLYGRNEPSRESTRHSWLSPVAMEMTKSLLESKSAIGFLDCTETSTLEEGLSRFILQLLQRDPKILRQTEDYEYIETNIAKTQDRTRNNRDERIEALGYALVRVINLHLDTVYIIVNRPDKCDSDDESCSQHLSMLLKLVQEVKSKLKILVVVKSESWHYKSRSWELDTKGAAGLFQPVELNQRRC